MKFLVDARLPFLDPYFSGAFQSTLIEVFFWAVLYLLLCSLVLSRAFRAIYRKLPIWTKARLRGGCICANGRDDIVLCSLWAIHHFAAAAFMYFGVHTGNPDFWRHGYLLESGYEVADLVAMFFKWYPYKYEGIKDETKAAFVFHHLPGLALCAFVMETGLYENVHMQAIGMWLLGAASISCFVGIVMYTLDFDRQMGMAALVCNLNVGFFLYCRFYVFPTEGLALLQDVKNSEELGNDKLLLYLLYFGLAALSIFNLAISIDMIPKCILYIRRAIDGVTPIETEPVPSSRDSVLRQRRRSSVSVVLDAVAATKRRSSSFATVMMLNTVECTLQKAPLHANGNNDDIAEEDLKALNKTLSSMNGKKKQ